MISALELNKSIDNKCDYHGDEFSIGVSEVNFLGVILDCALSWKCHPVL